MARAAWLRIARSQRSTHSQANRAGTRQMKLEDAYQVLGLEEDASEVEVKKAYRKQALKWHPDKNAGNEEEAKQQFQQVSAAYKRISCPDEDDEDEEEDGMNGFGVSEEEMYTMFNAMFGGLFGMPRGGGPFGGMPGGIFMHPGIFFDDEDSEEDSEEDDSSDVEFLGPGAAMLHHMMLRGGIMGGHLGMSGFAVPTYDSDDEDSDEDEDDDSEGGYLDADDVQELFEELLADGGGGLGGLGGFGMGTRGGAPGQRQHRGRGGGGGGEGGAGRNGAARARARARAHAAGADESATVEGGGSSRSQKRRDRRKKARATASATGASGASAGQGKSDEADRKMPAEAGEASGARAGGKKKRKNKKASATTEAAAMEL